MQSISPLDLLSYSSISEEWEALRRSFSRKYEAFLFRVQEIQLDGMAHTTWPVNGSKVCHYESLPRESRMEEERVVLRAVAGSFEAL